ncbi:MAG: hypothetical protein IT340_12535 [Chloroflexi bacterium]|nr:hypothetical protein [Chloroflexota bacterium]
MTVQETPRRVTRDTGRASGDRPPWRTPRPARPWRASPTILLDEEPDASLAIYGERGLAVLTVRLAHGGYRSHLVDPADVAAALAGQAVTTGLLPPATLAAGSLGQEAFMVQWRAPQPVTLTAVTGDKGGRTRDYQFPAPALVWGVCGEAYTLFALAGSAWPAPDSRLYHAPFPNVFDSGGVCWGSGRRPGPVDGAALEAAWAVFLHGSAFSWHAAGQRCRSFPANVLGLYQHLAQAGAATFPDDELLPTRWTVADLVAGRLWGRSA